MAGAGMKEIKTRIASVENTKQITKAMELVSSSKFRRAKEKAESSKAYFNTLKEAVENIAKSTSGVKSEFLKQREVKNRCYVVIAGDRGLAGGYNANVFKALAAETQGSKNVKVVTIGKKAKEFVSKRGFEVIGSIPSVENANYEDIMNISKTVMDSYQNGDIDEVKLIYTEFVSALSQEPRLVKLLPISIEANKGEEKKQSGAAVQYLPSADAVLGFIVPKYVSGMIYGGLAESYASEQAARRTAMESATDNANEMISNLELQYNRARQAAVTQEISEIVAGASSAQ
ncbi:MAG: ATP synthase F1 subunit gamma [Paraclostridium bifermentans]|uniref:ATP synthase gamma chain n=1 Tax=Paraclostridium bifermentans ATCC 638 = DSM 14991 TaxID=1233171 RepID=T4VI75_PARBF|nr:ATP synthase F1 subunit gamma [Paraclostridium bifermentans]EQK40815.1 ATP synthase F1, gamma subunit [[Clostridium] bifermentans ATCC 638] [Paraclostridium bifermentans ATCC 638 = DSM 14991]MBS6509376.1 ATP synthase F1 subunit gamma [Paraclostridium bifermentans]MDU3803631.1 ATP synthase F1 subunit gamma [Paraclostridium bifermentans]RIZ58082.1 ATP synthase F1 subunit gamma [Paraclostridium bifermentans]UAG18365.1 ATP synthase F1 subunit gamma [Paraclostridium bifermentans]